MTSSGFRGHDEAEGLTRIHPRIHSTATTDDVIQMQLEAFLDALAQMAMRVAERTLASGGAGEAA